MHRIATVGASPSSTRQASRARVLAALRVGGAMSRAELVAATGLARSTVATIVAELQDSGAVVDIDRPAPTTGRSGRRPVLLQLHGGPGAAVGVELTNGALRVVACDLAQRPLAFQTRPLDPGTDPAAVLRTVSAVIDEVLEAAGVDRAQVIGAGVTLPGPIRRRSGVVGRACTLPPWIGVRARDLASSLLGLPVLVDNDANLAALAEVTWGAGRGLSDVTYVYTATGIGTGLVLDGRIYAGASGTAGEIGHTTLDEDGRMCACGNRGCLNTVADAGAIVRELRHSYGDDLTIGDVIARASWGKAPCGTTGTALCTGSTSSVARSTPTTGTAATCTACAHRRRSAASRCASGAASSRRCVRASLSWMSRPAHYAPQPSWSPNSRATGSTMAWSIRTGGSGSARWTWPNGSPPARCSG